MDRQEQEEAPGGLALGRWCGLWLYELREGSKVTPTISSTSPSKVMRSFVQETECILDERRSPTGCLQGTLPFL